MYTFYFFDITCHLADAFIQSDLQLAFILHLISFILLFQVFFFAWKFETVLCEKEAL